MDWQGVGLGNIAPDFNVGAALPVQKIIHPGLSQGIKLRLYHKVTLIYYYHFYPHFFEGFFVVRRYATVGNQHVYLTDVADDGQVAFAKLGGVEIGRASCRERV